MIVLSLENSGVVLIPDMGAVSIPFEKRAAISWYGG